MQEFLSGVIIIVFASVFVLQYYGKLFLHIFLQHTLL